MKQYLGNLFAPLAFLCLSLGNVNAAPAPAKDFAAYYTHIASDEDFESYSCTGDYADVIVRLNETTQFVFWRGSSYLPYLQTKSGQYFVEELVKRNGDGDAKRPDRVNAYSYARILEQTPEKVVVEWRYLSDFTGGLYHSEANSNKSVQETYEITAKGNVTRTIKQGRGDLDIEAWNDPDNATIQTFRLTASGITNVAIAQTPHGYAQSPRTEGNPLKGTPVATPMLEFKFDEGAGYTTREEATGFNLPIAGDKNHWRKGVSGTAWEWDGWSNAITFPAGNMPLIGANDGFTLEAWICLTAYPWNWTPLLVKQGSYSLTINSKGKIAFQAALDSYKTICETSEPLTRNQWRHIAATFDAATRTATIYIDGKIEGNTPLVADGTLRDDASQPLIIGRAPLDGVVSDNTHSPNHPTMPMVVEGLIDEIKIYKTALTESQVRDSYKSYHPGNAVVNHPATGKHAFPSIRTKNFEAAYTTLDYYDAWNNHFRFSNAQDVVVGFADAPVKHIFWAGAQYMQTLVNEQNKWYTNAFLETWHKADSRIRGQEPMSDKEIVACHVKIIQDNPARKIIHWRYRLEDLSHGLPFYNDTTGWSDYGDFYHYIYPDGVSCKQMVLWTTGKMDREWQESIIINEDETLPEDNLEKIATLRYANLAGDAISYDWQPENINGIPDDRIQIVNLKGEYDPFTIVQNTGMHRSNAFRATAGSGSVFPWWNHWPAEIVISDGRKAFFPDRISHTSVTHYNPGVHRQNTSGNTPWQERILLEGLTRETNPAALIPLAKSWIQPAEITVLSGAAPDVLYDKAQRAYLLTAKERNIRFDLLASEDNPLQNACFVVKNWGSKKANANLKINGELISDFRQGIEIEPDGSYSLIIYKEISATKTVHFEIIHNS
jgi:hypothetical protein